jgi:hypothetical protein
MGARAAVKYAKGTDLRYADGHGGGIVYGRALCSDGKVRTLSRVAPFADTAFSVPAAVKVKGRTVSGFVMVETLGGWDTPSEEDPAVVKFVAYTYGRNASLLPAGKRKETA